MSEHDTPSTFSEAARLDREAEAGRTQPDPAAPGSWTEAERQDTERRRQDAERQAAQ